VTVAISLEPLFAFLASSAVWRFRVGRSGSSMAGVEPVSAGVLPVDVVDAVVSLPEEVLSGVRRFMVGRSGSPLVEDGLAVVDAVVSDLFVVWVGAGLLWSPPVAGVVSVFGFEPK
jgi:hypothetical protein